MTKIFQIFFCIVFAITFLGGVPKQQAHQQMSNGVAPDTLLKDVTATELEDIITSYRGDKAVLVNIWATWCAPCVEEFPEIVELQHNYSEDLKVILVSADFPKQRPDALNFLKKQDVNWTTYFKTGKDQKFIETLSSQWTGALPFTKIISRNGNVVASWEQSADYEKFERHVKTAIKP